MRNSLAISHPLSLPRYFNLRLPLNNRVILSLALTLLFLSFVFYIYQINAVISETYLINKYEKKLSELRQQNKVLEANFYSVNSLENVEKLIQNLSFEKVSAIHYIQVLAGQVVRNPQETNSNQ